MNKYREFYMKHMELGALPYNGLCGCFSPDPLLELFCPDWEERKRLHDEHIPWLFWGYGRPVAGDDWSYSKINYEFTPLRQTIVLLMAEMQDELDEIKEQETKT